MTMHYCVQMAEHHPIKREEVEKIIASTFTEVDQIYNYWNPLSELSLLNALGAGEKKELSYPLAAFLKKIDTAFLFTEGRFDPTVAPIKRCLQEGTLLADTTCIGWHHIHLEGNVFWKDHEATQIDLSGAVKGYAVDLITERLKDAGYHNIYVEWGGEVRTAGSHPQGRPWKIAILGGECVELKERAIATSGSYLQAWKIDEDIYTHIMDPFTKQPLKNGPIVSASVLEESCFKADVLATALMLFPSIEEADAWAEKNQITAWLISSHDPFPFSYPAR